MAQAARTLYSSSNGDRWDLVRDDEGGRVFVRHTPNAASGGQVGEFGIGEFLIRGLHGPEHLALLHMIGGLAGPGIEPGAERPVAP